MSDHAEEVREDGIYPMNDRRLEDEYRYPQSDAYLEARSPILVFFSIFFSLGSSMARMVADFFRR